MSDAPRGPIVFAGAATGLLLGLLLGLSATPVVAAVVGGLVTAAAAYWNLAGPAGDDAAGRRSQTSRALAAGFLCVGCVAGLLSGLWLRARDVFAVTAVQHVAAWQAAGYAPAEARALAAYQTTGLVMGGLAATGGERPATRSTVLFSDASRACDQVRPDDYADLDNLRAAFVQAGGRWRAMAEAARGADETVQLNLLRAAWQLTCE
jgi:hypothetical protein